MPRPGIALLVTLAGAGVWACGGKASTAQGTTTSTTTGGARQGEGGGTCGGATCCGNGVCDPGETCGTCAQDCQDAMGDPCPRVGMFYLGWHQPAYSAVQATLAR